MNYDVDPLDLGESGLCTDFFALRRQTKKLILFLELDTKKIVEVMMTLL